MKTLDTTVNEWLIESSAHLEKAGVMSARLDVLILLEDCISQDRAWLLAHPEYTLHSTQVAKLNNLLKRRVNHEPLAYLRGRCEFYGHEFVITSAVLQPRSESEAFIDLLKKLIDSGSLHVESGNPIHVGDIGAGSGALGITAALEVNNCLVTLFEIDQSAAKTARTNVDKFTLNIPIIISDLLEGVTDMFDVLLCNLPYIPDDYPINQAANYEPSLAIFGGTDGLDVYRKLFSQLNKRALKPLYILTESLLPQHEVLQELARQIGYNHTETDDLVQVFRHSNKLVNGL